MSHSYLIHEVTHSPPPNLPEGRDGREARYPTTRCLRILPIRRIFP